MKQTPSPQPELLELVDFKWLMAGVGRHVDLVRLQLDVHYADDCFECALHSECEPLRRCARHLHEQIVFAYGPWKPPER